MTLIRDLCEPDCETIHAIHTRCLTFTLASRYTAAQLHAWMLGRTASGYWNAARSGEGFLVAEVAGQVVGYASWSDDELLSLFIDPDHQKQGLGSSLLNGCLARAPNLMVVKAALGAESFYERHRFVQIGPGATIKHDVEIPDTRMRRSR